MSSFMRYEVICQRVGDMLVTDLETRLAFRVGARSIEAGWE